MDSVCAKVVDKDADEDGGLSCNISHHLLVTSDGAFLASIFDNFKTFEKA